MQNYRGVALDRGTNSISIVRGKRQNMWALAPGRNCVRSLLSEAGSKAISRGIRKCWRVEERRKGMKCPSRKVRERMG